METSEFVNSIADALTELTGQDIYGMVNSIKDSRFPVYVLHNITLQTFNGEWSIRVSKRVHSGEVNKEQVFRGLITELLSLLLRSAARGELNEHKQDLKF